MLRERPPTQIPATAEYVLATIQDQHRHLAGIYEADPHTDLTAETTIAQWREADELTDWRGLARGLDAYWKLGRSRAEWKAVLKPARKRTLGGLSAFIAASGATRPEIEPIGFLGVPPCPAAGAFAIVRSALREAGFDADAITPDSPLEPFLRGGVLLTRFWRSIDSLAPGTLPTLRVDHPPLEKPLAACVIGFMVAAGVSFLGLLHSPFPFFGPLTAVLGTMTLLAIIALTAVLECHRSTYELGDLRTFKDLARALAAGARPSVGI
ncbi:hypothetical protein [Paludisphaera mucosa]|uniref:Uncharacterized protein n=1 Tax=Paludisphaera mucosa TaxID=3030827 RepID=A0ABT6FJH2_9BACT|nr:hypothetical protein [Paludisphaera mucosa]MDG3007649.1 hypothetical protein [Paludisphaera mucosa]